MDRRAWISTVLLFAACGSAPPPHPTPAVEQKPELSGDRIRVVEQLGTPHLIRYSRPAYPKEARKAQIEGTVTLDVLVTKTGEVGEIHVISGQPALVAAAIEAVRKWRYTPTYLNGEPIEIKTRIDVPFTLHQ